MSQSLLASATAAHASNKHKTIELYNPSHIVEFKSTGTLTFRWAFSWEESVSQVIRSFLPYHDLDFALWIQAFVRMEAGRVLPHP